MRTGGSGKGMVWFYVAAAVAAGALLPVQAAVNARLRPWVGGPLSAALVSVLVSAALFLILALLLRPGLPAPADLAAAPPWVWAGGLLGAAVVLSSLVLVARLGAALAFALIVLGQLLASLALDHWGLLGLPHHPVTPLRLLGLALLLAGVALIRFF